MGEGKFLNLLLQTDFFLQNYYKELRVNLSIRLLYRQSYTDPSMSKSKGPPRNLSIMQIRHMLVSASFCRGLNCRPELPEGEKVGREDMSIVMNSQINRNVVPNIINWARPLRPELKKEALGTFHSRNKV